MLPVKRRSNIMIFTFFFFNDTATTEIYTLSLHDALPISLPIVKVVSSESEPNGMNVTSRIKIKDSARRITKPFKKLLLGLPPSGGFI